MEILIGAALLLVVLLYVRSRFAATTVYEWEAGLLYRKGHFIRTLDPGRYWIRSAITTIRKVDTRPSYKSVTGQEVLSSDGVTIKISLAARARIAEPAKFMNEVEDAFGGLYLELQLGLREMVGTLPIEEILATRGAINQKLFDLAMPKAPDYGLELLSVSVKDIMFPGDLKKIFAQVVKARQEGLAALERARGETAALRNLTNAADLVTKSPAVYQLRLLQVLSEQSGSTIVLGMDGTFLPLPVKADKSE